MWIRQGGLGADFFGNSCIGVPLAPQPCYNVGATGQPPPTGDSVMAAKLLTKAIAQTIPALCSQDGKGMEATAYLKLFTPWANWTWFVSEMDAETGQCFGLVVGLERELGYFNLRELEGIRGPGGLRIERDRFFEASPLSACC